MNEKGWRYNEIVIGQDNVPIDVLRAVSQGKATTPQIFIDGEYVGGADDLLKWVPTDQRQ